MVNWAKTASRYIGLAAIYSILISSGANAGPPFRTDDPEPVQTGHYEFYTFTSGTHVIDGTGGVGPAFEFNYGLIPNGQFHIVVPAAFNIPTDGPSSFGYADGRHLSNADNSNRRPRSRPWVGSRALVSSAVGTEELG